MNGGVVKLLARRVAPTLLLSVAGLTAISSTAVPVGSYAADPPLTTTKPIVEGYIAVGATATALVSGWGPEPLTLTYQWTSNGVAIPGAIDATYDIVEADALTELAVEVTGTSPGFEPATVVSDSHRVLRTLTTVSTPTIVGAALVGSPLDAVTGAWEPAPVPFVFQWLREGAPIAAATEARYVPTDADAGRAVSVQVMAVKPDFGYEVRESVAVTVWGVLTRPAAPTIVGVANPGETLTLKSGAWRPAPVATSIQWTRNGVDVRGATGATYRLSIKDGGTLVGARIVARKPGYLPVTLTAARRTVSRAMVPRVPVVTGTRKVGWTLVARPGMWRPADAVLTFQWYRNDSPIAGAVARTYRVRSGDRGARISVRVTARKPGYVTTWRQSIGTPAIS